MTDTDPTPLPRPDRAARYPSLAGRQVFVTGGATGVGAAIVDAFAAQGATVGYVDLDGAAGERRAEAMKRAHGVDPWFERLDVTHTDDLQDAIRRFAAAAGGLSVLVNNVANDARHDPMDVTVDGWRANLKVNVDAAFFASQAAVPLMRARGAGSIVNISSINAILGLPDMPGYVTAKAALLGLTKALANQYGQDGIRVNVVLPGWVATDRQLATHLTPEAEAAWAEQVALPGRIQPEDIAALVLFLGADDSRMMTSQTLVMDAGRT